jgi:hypothetical protein
MAHQIATAGWSLPGGAEHRIASWGFLIGPLTEWPGPTSVRDASEIRVFSHLAERVRLALAGPVLLPTSATPETRFAPHAPQTAFADREEATSFRARAQEIGVSGGAQPTRFSCASTTTSFGETTTQVVASASRRCCSAK